MSGYVAYPEYRDSGVEWLGKIPSHWQAIKIGHLSPVKRGASPRPIDDPIYFDDEGEYCWTRIADVSASKMYLEKSTQRLSDIGSSLSVKLEPGSLFLSIAGTVGKPCITVIKACIHDGFVYFPELKIPPKFLFYVFAGEQAYKGLGKFGTQLNLNTETVGGIAIGVSSPIDMQRIVEFLDHEAAKIDTLIEKQQQLIKLLKEKRQAVISHAVTKGLNPDAPMKDSGVEWLGEVPEHWITTKLSNRYIVQLGKMLDDKKITGEFLGEYLRNTDVQWGKINTKGLPKMDFKSSEKERFTVKKGDLLVCEGGEIGRCAIWANETECFYQKALHRLRPKSSAKDSSDYLYFVLFNCVHQGRFLSAAEKATIAHLPAEAFRQYIFAFPPYKEQLEIVSYLRVKEEEYENLKNNIDIQNSLLKERRTALISAAVTGKIDVRNWQPPTPQTTTSKDV